MGHFFGFLCLFFISIKKFRFYGSLFADEMKLIIKNLFPLVSLYAIFYLFVMVDRYFASYLPSGNMSGLSLASQIVFLITGLFSLPGIFITPLSEGHDRKSILQRAIIGVLFLSIPISVFVHHNAKEIIRMLFERGIFDAKATQITANALAVYIIGLPAFFLWPILYRLFQILETMKTIALVAILAVAINAILNYLFLFKLRYGLQGIAMATVLAYYYLVIASVYICRAHSIKVNYMLLSKYTFVSISGSIIIYYGIELLGIFNNLWIEVLFKGVVFVLIIGAYYYFLPINKDYNFLKYYLRNKFL
jgi:putative peptidoglycan lipid II flippase